MIGDELAHTIKQAVAQAIIDYRPFVYGHIASYDPQRHRVRCIVPAMTDENGRPLLTPWMPMGSISAGAGYGVQVVYRGGSTVDNPTAGEQVLIGLFDRTRGVSAVPALHFHDNARPPSTNLPDGAPEVAAGDVLVSNPSGTLLRIHPNGDFEIHGTGKLIANVTGDALIDTQGQVSVTSKGDATVTTTQGNAKVEAKIGTVTLESPTQINLSAPTIATDANGIGGKGQWHIEGDLSVSGNVSDFHGPLGDLRNHYNAHSHPDPQGGNVGATTQID